MPKNKALFPAKDGLGGWADPLDSHDDSKGMGLNDLAVLLVIAGCLSSDPNSEVPTVTNPTIGHSKGLLIKGPQGYHQWSLKNGGWTIIFPIGMLNFQGRTVKLQGGIPFAVDS